MGSEISVEDLRVKCGDAICCKMVSKSLLFWEICLFLRIEFRKQEQNEQEALSFDGRQETLRCVRWTWRILWNWPDFDPFVMGYLHLYGRSRPVGLYHLRHHRAATESVAESLINPSHSFGYQRSVPALILRGQLWFHRSRSYRRELLVQCWFAGRRWIQSIRKFRYTSLYQRIAIH